MTDAALPASLTRPGQLANLADLAAIPEEEIWLASQKSARTRRAYKQDVAHFMRQGCSTLVRLLCKQGYG